MSYTEDIFISYAHIDNAPLVEGQKGWITNFHRALEVRVAQLTGKTPRILRDAKIQDDDYVAAGLARRLQEVALLVSVLTPRYVQSEWCGRQVEEFLKSSEAGDGAVLDDRSRVFKVIKTPVPRERHPEELQKLLGYEFFVRDTESGRTRELDMTFGDQLGRDYWAKVDDLAHDICDLLGQLDAPSMATASSGDDAALVFLAETTFDLSPARENVRRDLLRKGFGVLPDGPLPLVASELTEQVTEDLARCRLSVHLVGQTYGVIPEESTASLIEVQNELAIARAGLPRLVWMPPELEVADQRQRDFIERLRTDARLQAGADILEKPLEELKSAIYRQLEPATSAAPEEPAALVEDEARLVRIYLICDQRDLDATPSLEDHLFDLGYEVVLPVFEGDEAQVREEHEETLCTCDATVVYYGAGNELWLRRKLREIQRSPGLGRSVPLAAEAIYVAPPESPRKARLRTRQAMVIQGGTVFEAERLEPFLSRLREWKLAQ